MSKMFISILFFSVLTIAQEITGPNKGLVEKTYTVCGRKLVLEEAKSERQRQIGLMHRKGIEPGKGMLFIFDQEQPLSFWMKNVPFDIEIGYFDKRGKLLNSHLMKGTSPLVQDHAQKTYPSTGMALFAVEVAPGFYTRSKDCRLEPLPKVD